MLGWLVAQKASVALRTDVRKVASLKIDCRRVSSVPLRSVISSSVKVSARYAFQSLHVRGYAKIVKGTAKTTSGKIPSKSRPLVYDEDFEDDEFALGEDFSAEDATHSEKKDASYLNSAHQMEEILRNSLPPDMVEAAIAEHRRIYPAYKSGNLSRSDAAKAGFASRIDTRQILQNLSDAASHPRSDDPFAAATSASSSSSTKGVNGSNSQDLKSTSSRASSSSSSSIRARQNGGATSLEDVLGKEMDELDDFDSDDPTGIVKKKDIGALFDHMAVSEFLEDEEEVPEVASQGIAKKKKLKRKLGKKSVKPIDPGALLHRRVELAKAMREEEEALKEEEEGVVDPELSETVEDVRESLKAFLQKRSQKKPENFGEPSPPKKSKKPFSENVEETPSKKNKKKVVSSLNETGESVSRAAMRARDMVAKGDWYGASMLYKAIGEEKDRVPILSAFAEQAYDAKQYQVAGEAAIAAFNVDPNDIRANVVAARVFLAQHEEYSSHHQNHPENAEKRLAMALQHADRALEQHPDWPDLLALKGSVSMCRKKYKTACMYFKAALAQLEKPEHRLLRVARNHIHRDYAKSLAGRGLYKDALAQLKYGLQLDPENVEIIGLLGELYERGFNDIETAASFYKMAVQVQPSDVPSLVRLGQLYADPIFSGRDLESARSCYERAMMLKPHAEFWFPLGWLSMHLGENDRALACLQRAAELDENEQNRWTSKILLAEIFALDTNPDTSNASLNKAVELYEIALHERGDTEVQLNLAKCLLRLDRFHDAQILLEAIKGEDPDNCDLKCVLVEAYHVGGRLNEASRELEVVIKEHPSEPMPQFMKGKYLYDSADYIAAMPYLERSVMSILKPSPKLEDFQDDDISAISEKSEKSLKSGKSSKSSKSSDPSDGVEPLKKSGKKSASKSRQSESNGESDVTSVIKELEAKVREINPAQLEALRMQAQSMANVSADSESKLPADSILRESAPEVPVYAGEAFRLLSRCYFEAEMFLEAKKAIGYALGFESESASLLTALGECLIRLEDFDEAITTFRKASVLHPSAIWPAYQLGTLLFQQQRPEQAITYYEKALSAIDLRMDDSASPDEVDTNVSEEDLAEILPIIYSNMSACCTQMAALDRVNSAKYHKLAKQWSQYGLQLRSLTQ
jgi:tetratricopeptide (TPR) repeat protein